MCVFAESIEINLLISPLSTLPSVSLEQEHLLYNHNTIPVHKTFIIDK